MIDLPPICEPRQTLRKPIFPVRKGLREKEPREVVRCDLLDREEKVPAWRGSKNSRLTYMNSLLLRSLGVREGLKLEQMITQLD